MKKIISLVLFSFLVFLLNNNNNTLYGQQQKQVLYLSGTDNENTVTWDFFCTGGRKCNVWTSIEVPSCWEQQGFGTYNYGRDYHTYGKKFRYADEQGIYRYDFQVPADWKDREIYIIFEGVMTDAEVFINGKSAGAKHRGAFYRFEYNITSLVKAGSVNQLEVNVSKMSDNKSVNHAERYADYWIFGGIFRPVYLESFPKAHIHRTAIIADAKGHFTMDLFPENIRNEHSMEVAILDGNKKVAALTRTKIKPGDSVVRVFARVTDPLLWTAETPNLYTAEVRLSSKGEILYTTSQRFGFRTVEVRPGDGIYINGTKIKMKGINRHCFWPETGRTLNYTINLMDVKLMREMNMNAVRCSHYPPDEEFLDLCDSLGLYVLDELAGWQNAYDTETGEKLVKEMVIRDVNHPSILFWSNGNEGGHNKDLDDDYARYDPSGRPVIHAHHRPGNAFNHIDCNHYENYYSSGSILNDSLIYMVTEFLHCQEDGGGGAGLHDFWEQMLDAPRSGGGFLWALIDEGLVRTDMNNLIDVNRVNANDGVLGPHREKEGSFYAIREIFSPVYTGMKEMPDTFDGIMEVENRYAFINLNQCSFKIALVNFRKPWEDQPGHITEFEKTIPGPIVPPGMKGQLNLDLPVDWKGYDAMLLTVCNPSGEAVYDRSWKTKGNLEILDPFTEFENDNKTETTDGDSSITMSASGISAEFSKTTGRLIKLENRHGKGLLFNNGPVLCSGSARMKEIKQYKENDGNTVESLFEGDLLYTKWKMHHNGWVSLEYEYSLEGDYPYAGISFNYPASNIIGAKWFGKGPVRVWKNRMYGVNYDVWESLYNDTWTGQSPWIYPEFKGYFADVGWLELNTTEGKLLMISKEDDLFVRLFDFYALSGEKPYPDLPVGDISMLDCIPPIGTKMATRIDRNASVLGPESNMNTISTPVKRTLYFYFGLPGE
ncbi:MAG: glycoside hydrolase family 2 [Bacteroidales bacterium]|nr:glycoside hydrolase family 2 [Bacteroidales bacterium]MBN2762604.1 glycoside hydrolase family 2 [Bacteroidales bacterium]